MLKHLLFNGKLAQNFFTNKLSYRVFWESNFPFLNGKLFWGCPTEVRVYNPQEKKRNSKTISGFLISYQEKSKGYRINYPNHGTRIVEIGNSRFI